MEAVEPAPEMTAEASAPAPREHRVVRLAGKRDPLGLDLYEGLKLWPLWTMLGWSDIRQRYRRSTLGPFWITLSTGIFILVLGVIYGRLLRMDIGTFLPYFAVGYIVWTFVSSATVDSCNAFLESERIIKQIKRPFSVYVLRVVWRNFAAFLHTAIIFLPVLIFFNVDTGLVVVLAIPGFALLLVNQVWVGLVVAMLNSRFRDVLQMVTTAMQILFFSTPIMYPVEALGDAAIIAHANPAHHFVDIVRAPLLGKVPALESWLAALATIVVGYLVALLLFRRVERRIVYWL
jgi:ABC-type polysaccharide/polyol phosphate export permease